MRYASISTDGQFQSRGFVSPITQYGFFTETEVETIEFFARKCGYTIDPGLDFEPTKVKIFSKDFQKFGYIRPLWDKLEDGTWGKKIVFGFYKGKRWITKYNIYHNIQSLADMMKDIRDGKVKGLNSVRMMSAYKYKILIKDLENEITRRLISHYYVPEQ